MVKLFSLALPVSVKVQNEGFLYLYWSLQLIAVGLLVLIYLFFPHFSNCRDYPIRPYLRFGVEFPSCMIPVHSFSINPGLCLAMESTMPHVKARRCLRVCSWEEDPIDQVCVPSQEFVKVMSVTDNADTLSVISSYIVAKSRDADPKELQPVYTYLVPGAAALVVNCRLDLAWTHPRASIDGASTILVLDTDDKVLQRFDNIAFSLTVETILSALGSSQPDPEFGVLPPSLEEETLRTARSLAYEPGLLLGTEVDVIPSCFSRKEFLKDAMKEDPPADLDFDKPVCLVRFMRKGKARVPKHSVLFEAFDDEKVGFENQVRLSARPGDGKVCMLEEGCILQFVLLCLLVISLPIRIVRFVATRLCGLMSKIYDTAFITKFSIRDQSLILAANVINISIQFARMHQEEGSGVHHIPKWRMHERLHKAVGLEYNSMEIAQIVDELYREAFQHGHSKKQSSILWRQHDARVIQKIFGGDDRAEVDIENATIDASANYQVQQQGRSEENTESSRVLGLNAKRISPKELQKQLARQDKNDMMDVFIFTLICIAYFPPICYIEITHLFDDRRPLAGVEEICMPKFLHDLRISYRTHKKVQKPDHSVKSIEEHWLHRRKLIGTVLQVNAEYEDTIFKLKPYLTRMMRRLEGIPEEADENGNVVKHTAVKTWRDWIRDAQAKQQEGELKALNKRDREHDASKDNSSTVSPQNNSCDPIPTASVNDAEQEARASPSMDQNVVSPGAAKATPLASPVEFPARAAKYVANPMQKASPDQLPARAASDVASPAQPSPCVQEALPSSSHQANEADVSKAESAEVVRSAEVVEETESPSPQLKKASDSSPEQTRLFMSYVQKLQAVLNWWEKKQTKSSCKISHRQAQAVIEEILRLPPPLAATLELEFGVTQKDAWKREVARYEALSRAVHTPELGFWHEIGLLGTEVHGASGQPSPRVASLKAALEQRVENTSGSEPFSWDDKDADISLEKATRLSETEEDKVIAGKVNALNR